MNKPKNSRHTLMCIEVKNAYLTRKDKPVHLVRFQDGHTVYTAEACDGSDVAKFTKGTISTFVVTFPGNHGKPDWILWEGDAGRVPTQEEPFDYQPPVQVHVPKDNSDIGVAQTALLGAVQYGIKNEYSKEQIVELAHIFAGNIKRIAKAIANDPTI